MPAQDLQTLVVDTGKRWLSIAPVALEIFVTFFVLFVLHALLTRHRNIKHSAFSSAVWKVHQDREHPIDMLSEKFFQNPQGLWMHYRVWKNDQVERDPKGLIILCHGMSEHIDRHSHTAEFYVSKGYFVLGIDHQGYGRSEGDRAHVESFDHYSDDLLHFLGEFLPVKFPQYALVPKFIQAHSMGALVTFRAAIRAQESNNPWHNITGIVLGNGAIGKHQLDPVSHFALRVLSVLVPKWELFSFPGQKSTNFLMAKQQSYFDPVNHLGGLRPHHLTQVLVAQGEMEELIPKLKTPTYLFHGTEDLTVPADGSRRMYELMKELDPDADITLNELHGFYHEPLQEEKHVREPILEEIEAWVASKAEEAANVST